MTNASNFTTYISSNNQPCMTRPTLFNLNLNEFDQGLRCYPVMVNLDRCNGFCDTLHYPSSKICIANKTKEINLNVFNIIKRNNEAKALTKHISSKCKCKFDRTKCNSNQKWKYDRFLFETKNPMKHMCEKDYVWNFSTRPCENGTYLENNIGDSAVVCDEIIEVTKSISTKTVPTKTI